MSILSLDVELELNFRLEILVVFANCSSSGEEGV